MLFLGVEKDVISSVLADCWKLDIEVEELEDAPYIYNVFPNINLQFLE